MVVERRTMGFSHVGNPGGSVSRVLLVTFAGNAQVRAIALSYGHGWCTMREEFASYSFLALTVAGVVLLGAGLDAFAIT
jgi:hypothetical protein